MNISFEIGAGPVLAPLLTVFAVVLVRRARRGDPAWTGRHAALRTAAAVYAAAVLSITVLPIAVTWGQYANQMPWYTQLNFVPLLTLDVTAVPNIVMMIPLGALLPLLSARASSLARTTWLTAAASLAIETAQLLSYLAFNNGRAVDVNDLLVNTLGGMIGWALLAVARRSEALRGTVQDLALPGSAAAQLSISTSSRPVA